MHKACALSRAHLLPLPSSLVDLSLGDPSHHQLPFFLSPLKIYKDVAEEGRERSTWLLIFIKIERESVDSRWLMAMGDEDGSRRWRILS